MPFAPEAVLAIPGRWQVQECARHKKRKLADDGGGASKQERLSFVVPTTLLSC